ncbi:MULTISPECIES: hypothetical protein [unclassified Oceanispirochaeta]|uniref:hypothetical protein n=1 Tax=unclassified Oceanispirochaeta TaxID=2635722 RepID=UPI000E091BDD|nr:MULTISPECIES: hypothetical protein [unclassified Oceanispirochaeta]MBF9015111.1 hypothetical protein [Oceanispirochaeta sp. M2]NPD71569.1 hypothetical protein [Oceanispirochaeta sp. M1]RDG33137.1 hypothetical protein DV872_05600 [Oceanispirochaeta sp. M1]
MKKIYILILLMSSLLFMGCEKIDGMLHPNKIAGNWYGYDRDGAELSAELSITESDTFKATFHHGDEAISVSGSYSHTAQGTFMFSDDEYGAVIFQYDGIISACQYVVTSSSLELRNWKDADGSLRTLSLFR